jgi:conjugative relaxase-like TrwC/TraI family protein
MLNFTVLKSSTDLKNYYRPDYFLENAETRAFFGGTLAERLGLDEFDVEQFHDLCDGLVPGSRTARNPEGEKLTPGRKEGARAGWDVTVDGPKDLGVLMALGLDDRIVPLVLERAARDVAAEIERDAKTRVRVGKQDTDRTTGNIAYTGILHLTARPVGGNIDVQPHIHLLVHNATYDPVEKKLKALQLQPFAANGTKADRPYYTALLNARLAQYMQELGYEIEPDRKTGSFRVVGVPDRVRKEFSQRTNKIEAVAAMLEKAKQKFLGDPNAKLCRGEGAARRTHPRAEAAGPDLGVAA